MAEMRKSLFDVLREQKECSVFLLLVSSVLIINIRLQDCSIIKSFHCSYHTFEFKFSTVPLFLIRVLSLVEVQFH